MRIPQLLINAIIIAAAIAILLVALPYFGIAIPQIAYTIFWILIIATVCVLAIKYLMTLKG